MNMKKPSVDNGADRSMDREGNNLYSAMLGAAVLTRRNQLKMTQDELAKKARTTQKRISLIESSTGNATQNVIDRILEVLGVRGISFLYWEESDRECGSNEESQGLQI